MADREVEHPAARPVILRDWRAPPKKILDLLSLLPRESDACRDARSPCPEVEGVNETGEGRLEDEVREGKERVRVMRVADLHRTEHHLKAGPDRPSLVN